MTKILFICHGNICRSPMAEFVMKHIVEEAGQKGLFEIASAATSTEELGNPVHPSTRRMLAEHGIDSAGKTARQLQKSDYTRYDYLVGMDSANIRNMLRICGEDTEGKIFRLLDFTDHPSDIADPWYTDDFEQTWRDVSRGCRALLEKIQK